MHYVTRRTSRRSLRFRSLALLVALPLVASCLSVETEVDLGGRGAVRMSYRYTIDAAAWNRGVFDASAPIRSIPVTERDARDVAARLPGVELRRYRLRERDDAVTVESVYALQDATQIAHVWGAAGEARFRVDLEARTLVLPLNVGGRAMTDEESTLVEELFAGETVTVVVVAPSSPTARLDGFDRAVTVDGRRVAVTLPLASILVTAEPIDLIVTW